MKKKLLYYFVLLLVLVVGGFYLMKQPATAPEGPQPIVVTLASQNDSGISGNAVISEEDGKMKVVLDLMGVPNDLQQPAHIHLGTCSSIGAVKYPLTPFPKGGKGEAVLDTTIAELHASQPIAINVHKSLAEVATYVACGDVVF